MRNVAYDIRFNGTGYEVFRTRTHITIPPSVNTFGPFATRELAEKEVRFLKDMDLDKQRDRAGY